MKPLLLLGLVALLASACKKDAVPFTTVFGFKGIWVEKSLRLDTIDLNNVPEGRDFSGNRLFTLRSAAYAPPASAFFLVPHSMPFAYNLGDNRIAIHNAFGATLNFPLYDFTWSADRKSFTVGRFYLRNTLPNSIVFERIK